MVELNAQEARVIGVLIEKAQTTPDQYPLTVNAVVNGANQKNNRHPLTSIDDGDALSALISLRNKGLVVQQDGHGQRVPKFRHQFKEALNVNMREMAILAELLLRGPQTLGELRGRASRMYPLESLEMVKNVVEQLANKPEPLVKQIPPAPGSRAERYEQLLSLGLHEVEVGTGDADVADAAPARGGGVNDRVARLEAEVTSLRGAIAKLAAEMGVSNPLEAAGSAGEGDAATGRVS